MPNLYSKIHKYSDNRAENVFGNTGKCFLPVKYLFVSFTQWKQQLRRAENAKTSDVLRILQLHKTLFLLEEQRWCEKQQSASAEMKN